MPENIHDMGKKIKEIDAYIEKAADFAKPILTHIRKIIHEACPDTEEKMKWSFPHFDYKNEIMCSMASFKQHCAFGFWKASLMKDKALFEMAQSESAMGHFGKITSMKDLPPDKKLKTYIKEAMLLNDKGIKLKATPAAEKKIIVVPDDFAVALKKNKKALVVFEAGSYSFRKEYVQWIEDAKTTETRLKRMAAAIEWIAEKKGRNWKYERK